jgi:hypothetical protein
MKEVLHCALDDAEALSARHHLTGVQLICIVVLWGVRSSPVVGRCTLTP